MRKPRRELRMLVDIRAELRGERAVLPASVRDLSVYGLRIRFAGRITLGERVGVTLTLPGFASIDFSGDVRWISRRDFGVEWDAGLEINHTEESRKTMQLLLWELQSGSLSQVERRTRTHRIERKGTTAVGMR